MKSLNDFKRLILHPEIVSPRHPFEHGYAIAFHQKKIAGDLNVKNAPRELETPGMRGS